MEEAKLNSIEQKIFNEYTDQDNCMGDFLCTKKVPRGMSFREAVIMYASLMHYVENDELYRINRGENWQENLVTGITKPLE